LNIPNYGSALSGYLPLSGGTLTGALNGTSLSMSGGGSFGGDFGLSYSKSLYWNSISNQYITADASGLYLGTANLSRLFVNTSGNVGIGTTSPSTALHVIGAATFSSSVTATEGLFGGAVTNGVDKLRVNGNTSTSQLITGSFNPNMTLRNTATTLSSLYTTVIAQGGSSYTYTLDAASGHNRIYIIRAYGSGTSITLNRSGSDVIVDNAGNNQTSLTITPSGGAVWVQSNGSDAYIQLK
jgi:hypothetical protein